ncbi:WD domain-containing protein [Metarhizium acridum CQMa 102]|uniref:WD domain-containing protein n=1 Tax=Metarhizium acridum (strain CQMa 102) TaxID=655827 RepID=E9E9J6_METAQ|nr:WD domain-containing protein [Metarhizium acridum CQMa 102]EFY87436.1 WD domain-containing protein [Metarhizium acridum CQMa 102]
MVDKEFIDSNRVNFLVWRYLLEANYRETAAKLQKEWQVNEPHRDFSFAPHVKSQALVSLINRGLMYYALEREFALNKRSRDAASAGAEAEAESLQVGVFGPLNSQQLAEGEGAAVGGDVELSRKRIQQQLQLPNGSPAKKPRLSNGYTDASASASAPVATAATTTSTTTNTTSTSATTPMDIDPSHHHHPHPQPNSHDGQHDASNNHAYPSPLEGEQLPPPIIHTDGPEQGTQVDKVEELSPDTTFIHLVDSSLKASEATATPSPSPVGAEIAPVLLQCEWNPCDPSMLAAAGTDALARVWTICRSSDATTESAKDGRDHVAPLASALIDPAMPRTTTVTALSWTPNGTAIAVATDLETSAAVSVWSADGVLMQTMDVAEPPIIKLSWNPGSSALLSLSPEKGGGALITVYSFNGKILNYHLPGHDIETTALDAAWIDDEEFLLSGGDLLLCLRCTNSAIIQSRKFETTEDDSFTQVLFDRRSKLAATSSDKGILDLWDESGQRRSISAHQGAITTMAWQPLPPNQAPHDDERLIATGGDDCAILIWNARKPESKAKCFLTMDLPIVRLAFTPDGAFIAGASSRQVLIWKVDNHTMPRASWNRPPHPGWLSPKGNSDTEEEDEHCLCWDVSGQKLAYGSNSRLAVINFRR